MAGCRNTCHMASAIGMAQVHALQITWHAGRGMPPRWRPQKRACHAMPPMPCRDSQAAARRLSGSRLSMAVVTGQPLEARASGDALQLGSRYAARFWDSLGPPSWLLRRFSLDEAGGPQAVAANRDSVVVVTRLRHSCRCEVLSEPSQALRICSL